MKTLGCVILWMLSLLQPGRAQEPALQQSLEDLIESMGSETDETNDYQEVIDDLTYLSQHPLPINKATKEELLKLHFLSELQINELMDYRNRTGQIYSIYELSAIEGYYPDLLQKLKPFISFETFETTSTYKKSDNDLILRTTRSFGNSSDSKQPDYEGSMERYYLRFKHISNNYEYGMIAEKDPGEALFKASNKGFDYMGGYANLKIGSALRLFAGDYRVQFGQGLVASQGFSMGKTSETAQVFRFGQGIRSSSSSDENQFFRGMAAKLIWEKVTLMPFISFRQLDAHIDTIEGKPYFGAFQTSGYHRTASEITGKNTLRQIVYGGSVNVSINRWTIGLTGISTRFNAELNRSDEPYNQFLWEGKENFVAGMDWKGSIKNVFLFGEIAASKDNGRALISGILLKPAVNAEISVVYRNINKTYFSFYSNALTESSKTNDERGLYLGFKYYPASKWTLSGYADLFNYRWIKYTTAAPSNGNEIFAQLSFKVSGRTDLYARFFQEDKEVKVTTINNKYNQPQQIKRGRLNYTQKLSESLNLNSRIEWMSYSKFNNESGFLIYQDISYKPLIRKLSFNGRIAYFASHSYYSRIYAYENDLLYSFSIPALFGKGIRTYINIKQSVNDKLSLWLKLAATYPFSPENTAESDEQNAEYELKLQLRYKF
ncbi:MAG TPA: helix-hairpin-helix domain-containing protein [Prolixibacteraceae bacterium]|nr:helix-hairpin-helix domain-containing protein [Prolixibacteraceae bacterium]